MSDHPDYLTTLEPVGDIVFAGAGRVSVADLHRRCIALEDERRCLADEIIEHRAAVTAESRQLIEREAAVIREIGSILDRMQTASVTTIDDIAALVDLVLDIEFDVENEIDQCRDVIDGGHRSGLHPIEHAADLANDG